MSTIMWPLYNLSTIKRLEQLVEETAGIQTDFRSVQVCAFELPEGIPTFRFSSETIQYFTNLYIYDEITIPGLGLNIEFKDFVNWVSKSKILFDNEPITYDKFIDLYRPGTSKF